jgi:guanosine-3',5'-bis(diphosphate) 3'-pyrophosphohydrolase
MTDLQGFLPAAAFAARKHQDQRRKDAQASPYINHPLTLMAAVLHDTLEDTETTPEELAAGFGVAVRDLVQEVTDDKRLSKPERKRRQAMTASGLSDRAKLVRIADKIANIQDVAHHPPVHWDLKRRRDYLEWTADVVAGCRGVNPRLEAAYDQILRDGRSILDFQRGDSPEE